MAYTYLRERVRSIFQLNDPAPKLALAFALGVFVAFSPTMGLHTLSCIVFAWIFRVKVLVVLTGSFIMNPWTLVPLYSFCLWVGIKLTGSTIVLPQIAWSGLEIMDVFVILKPYLWPFVAGTLFVGSIAAVVSYFLFAWAITRFRKADRDTEQPHA